MPCPSGLPAEVQTETHLESCQSAGPRDRLEGTPSAPAVQLRTSPPQGGSREPPHFGSGRHRRAPGRPTGQLDGEPGPREAGPPPGVYTEYLAKSLLSNTTCVAK